MLVFLQKGGRLQVCIGIQFGGKGLRNIVFIFVIIYVQYVVYIELEWFVFQWWDSQQLGWCGQGDVGLELLVEVYLQQDEKVLKQWVVRFLVLCFCGIVGGKGDEELVVGIYCFVIQWCIVVQEEVVIVVKFQWLVDCYWMQVVWVYFDGGFWGQQGDQCLDFLLGFVWLMQYVGQCQKV